MLKIPAQFEDRNYKEKDFLLKIGQFIDYFFLSESLIRVFTFDTQGKDVTTYFYLQDRKVFDASSFFLHNPSNENIQAIITCKGFTTRFIKLNALFHTFPEFRECGRRMIVREFVACKQRILDMINQSAEERYLWIMETNRDIFQYAQKIGDRKVVTTDSDHTKSSCLNQSLIYKILLKSLRNVILLQMHDCDQNEELFDSARNNNFIGNNFINDKTNINLHLSPWPKLQLESMTNLK